MKFPMKSLAPLFFLGFALAASTAPVFARSTTGFASFHVEQTVTTADDFYKCITEDNGAVVNNCAKDVNLVFNLPIDNVNLKTITVQGYWVSPTTFRHFNCVSYSYDGLESFSTVGTQITFTEPKQSLKTSVTLRDSEYTVQVICWGVPPGEGIAGLKWNP